MPITDVEFNRDVKYVSVLDEKGKLDKDLEPKIPKKDLRALYEAMVRVRFYDEQRLRLQRQGRIGTFAPVKGQEAAQLGSIYALQKTDWFVPAFRETMAATWRGAKFEDDLLYCAGYEEGINIPEDAHDLPIAIPVGSQTTYATGIAWANRLQKKDEVVLCYFGDGATSEGDFHESLNFASLHKAPVVFLCQNNQWAISVPRHKQTASPSLAQKGIAYEMPSVQVDGNDLLAMYRVTKEAVDRARKGDGPTLIEAVTYRLSVHTTADDPTRYRSEEEVKKWEKKDPVVRFREYLKKEKVITDDDIVKIQEAAKKEVQEATKRFEERAKELGDPADMFDHRFKKNPYTLERQREEVQELTEAGLIPWGTHE